MSWVLAMGLALGAFALAAFVLGVSRQGWTTLAAALALGLAGYSLQASPGMTGAPAERGLDTGEAAWQTVDARKEMVGGGISSNRLVVADAFTRRGRYATAAGMLRAAVAENPRDFEAWLALGNVLVEHADGALTQPALFAYRRAAELAPDSAGPGYFLGLALIRQGRLPEAQGIWAATLQSASDDAAGREALADRLARLDALLANQGTVPQ